MTPTSPTTIQLGTVFYDVLYIPLRTAVFLVLVGLAFGLDFHADGFVPALVVLFAFIPFVWGLGVANAGFLLTFRRGGGAAALLFTMLALFSGAFFPLDLLPSWLQGAAELNPIAIAIEGMREPLAAPAGKASGQLILVLLLLSIASLAAGLLVFQAALRRERRRGSLGLYCDACRRRRRVWRYRPLAEDQAGARAAVDRLVDRAPTLEDILSHRLDLFAARRWRVSGRPVPAELIERERRAAVGALVVPLVFERSVQPTTAT